MKCFTILSDFQFPTVIAQLLVCCSFMFSGVNFIMPAYLECFHLSSIHC